MITALFLFHLFAGMPCEINPRWRVRVTKHVLLVDWVDI